MKKILLLSAIAVGSALTGCSDDATTNDAQDTSMDLLKTVMYVPTKDAYENNVEGSNKNVQYFEDGKMIADTTFDISGNIVSRVVHTYTANMHTKEILVNETPWVTLNYLFDNDGRIIEKRSDIYLSSSDTSTSIRKFVYNTGSVTQNSYDPDTNQLMPQYTYSTPLNSAGLIQWDGLTYQDDKPVQWNFTATEESASVNLEYYDVPMPANQAKTINQLNNLSFLGEDMRYGLIENNNYHLKKYTITTSPTPSTTLVTFEKNFNELGYVIYSKAVGTAFESLRDSETFYYYE